MPTVRNMHMSTLVDDEKQEVTNLLRNLRRRSHHAQLVFLYKLVDGIAAGSFGTHVARLAGVPEDVVKRADVLSKDFARQFGTRTAGRQRVQVPVSAQADFAWLCRLASGAEQLPENKVRQREVLEGLRASMRALFIEKPRA
jgi:DNA mismatch repair protein MSH6